jgi:hypothetical protein
LSELAGVVKVTPACVVNAAADTIEAQHAKPTLSISILMENRVDKLMQLEATHLC